MSKTDKVARIWREDQLKNHPEQTNVWRPDLMHLPQGAKGDRGPEFNTEEKIAKLRDEILKLKLSINLLVHNLPFNNEEFKEMVEDEFGCIKGRNDETG